jgi:hypothetical protein
MGGSNAVASSPTRPWRLQVLNQRRLDHRGGGRRFFAVV